VCLQGRDRQVFGIRSYHSAYDPLSYPLFSHDRGEQGWHSGIPKVGVDYVQVVKKSQNGTSEQLHRDINSGLFVC